MARITDPEIRKALVEVEQTGRTKTLSDGSGRGEGRLSLIVRKVPSGSLAEWYAVQYVAGKRKQAKLGSYPGLSLKDAREAFRTDFAGAIRQGADAKAARDQVRAERRQAGTVHQLFSAYIEHQKSVGRMTWKETEKGLLTGSAAAVKSLGKDRLARDIKPADIVAWLSPVFTRGAASHAAHLRAYASAAFRWGMKADNDYKVKRTVDVRWGIEHDPVAAVPRDATATKVRERALSPDELASFWIWLCSKDYAASKAVRLQLLLGVRVLEIARLEASQVGKDGVLRWEWTKAGRPHQLPLAPMARAIVETLPKSGQLFGLDESAARQLIGRYCEDTGAATFQARDIRRTWRTLAAKAGVTREEAAIIQNHAPEIGITGWKVYDKAERLEIKLPALLKWERWLTALIAKKAERAA